MVTTSSLVWNHFYVPGERSSPYFRIIKLSQYTEQGDRTEEGGGDWLTKSRQILEERPETLHSSNETPKTPTESKSKDLHYNPDVVDSTPGVPFNRVYIKLWRRYDTLCLSVLPVLNSETLTQEPTRRLNYYLEEWGGIWGWEDGY